MADFDYDHVQFKKWWIDLWVKYVLEFGVDGYRLDGPNGYESPQKTLAVWNEITAKCAKKGHPIVVFPETF
jgi:glycosidase